MTSNELKHEAKKQEWSMSIQECRGSGLSVSEWCRQLGVTTATYYRWERELLTGVQKNGALSSTAVTFAELPAPKQVSCNVAERSATLHDTCFGAESSANLTADTLEHGSVSAKARNSRSQR